MTGTVLQHLFVYINVIDISARRTLDEAGVLHHVGGFAVLPCLPEHFELAMSATEELIPAHFGTADIAVVPISVFAVGYFFGGVGPVFILHHDIPRKLAYQLKVVGLDESGNVASQPIGIGVGVAVGRLDLAIHLKWKPSGRGVIPKVFSTYFVISV